MKSPRKTAWIVPYSGDFSRRFALFGGRRGHGEVLSMRGVFDVSGGHGRFHREDVTAKACTIWGMEVASDTRCAVEKLSDLC